MSMGFVKFPITFFVSRFLALFLSTKYAFCSISDAVSFAVQAYHVLGARPPAPGEIEYLFYYYLSPESFRKHKKALDT